MTRDVADGGNWQPPERLTIINWCDACGRQMTGHPPRCMNVGCPNSQEEHRNDNWRSKMEQQRLDVGEPDPAEEIAQRLATWWRDTSESELEATIPKAVEYGASDLKIMGRAMETLIPGCGEVGGMEAAVAFYVLGKVSRLFGAYEEGRTPSDDTWMDIAVYAKMAQHIREHGEWV